MVSDLATVRAWVATTGTAPPRIVRNDLLWRLPATPHRTIHGRFVCTDV